MEPELSIVVPSFNRVRLLRNLLRALARQDVAASSFEVIVVLDGSTDASSGFLGRVSTPFRLRVVEVPHGGASTARNAGVVLASAPYCLFLDDDMTPGGALVREHLAAQRDGGGVLTVGAIATRITRRGFPQCLERFWAEYGARRRAGIPLTPHDCFTGNLSLPVPAFRAVGGFDARLRRAEDVDLAFRLNSAGLPMVYAANARATQQYDKTTVAALRDDHATGLATSRLLRSHPEIVASHYVAAAAGRDPLYAELVRFAAHARIPDPMLAAAGTLPYGFPGSKLLFGFMRTQAYMGGVRTGLNDEPAWDALTTGVRILNYHAFAREGEMPSKFVMASSAFREQLNWLKHWGANIMPLSEYVSRRERGIVPPRFTVVLTMDDAYAEVATEAAPVLAELRLPWTLFAVAEMPGRNEWDTAAPLGRRPLLSPTSLRALADGGCEVGAHSQTHRRLRRLTAGELRLETVTARESLREVLGRDVTLFAYPFGESDAAARDAVREAGYRAGVGVRFCKGTTGMVAGPRSDAFALPRIDVPGGIPLWQFKNLVRWGRTVPFQGISRHSK